MGKNKNCEYMRKYRERKIKNGERRYEFWLTPDQLKQIQRIMKEWKS